MNKKTSLINLGCRLNIYEGEIIKNHLNNNNLNEVTVINSCAVTAEAEKKVAYEIRKAKRNKPNNKIIVTGCSAQIDPKKYESLKEVTKALLNQYPLMEKQRIVGHSDIAPSRKTDPGPSFSWKKYRSSLS